MGVPQGLILSPYLLFIFVKITFFSFEFNKIFCFHNKASCNQKHLLPAWSAQEFEGRGLNKAFH